MNMKMVLSVPVLAMALGLVACGDSSSSESDAICEVTRSGGTVKVYNAYMGATYTSTAKIVGDDKIEFHSVYTYPTQAYADEACRDEMEEAEEWLDGSYKVSCSGKSVTVDDYSEYFHVDEDDLKEVEDDWNRMCANFADRVNRGDMNDYDEDDDY